MTVGTRRRRTSARCPIPRAACAASTSSGPVGSLSRRRLPNTMKAIAIVTPPVVTTAVGATAASVATTLGGGAPRLSDDGARAARRRRTRPPGRTGRCRPRRSRRRRSRPRPARGTAEDTPAVTGSASGDGLGERLGPLGPGSRRVPGSASRSAGASAGGDLRAGLGGRPPSASDRGVTARLGRGLRGGLGRRLGRGLRRRLRGRAGVIDRSGPGVEVNVSRPRDSKR